MTGESDLERGDEPAPAADGAPDDAAGAAPSTDADHVSASTHPGEAATADARADARADAEADAAGAIGDAQAAIDEARRRVAEVPAEVVVTNHVMGLYELAAIHLSSDSPDLRSAALAIDAVSCLVEGLGDRLGPEAPTMRDALANIRLAFVQIKRRPA